MSVVEKVKAKAGGNTVLARELGITPQAVAQWRVIPAERVLDIERITGVSRHEQRPDVFGSVPESVCGGGAEAARGSHKPEVAGSSPAPATSHTLKSEPGREGVPSGAFPLPTCPEAAE